MSSVTRACDTGQGNSLRTLPLTAWGEESRGAIHNVDAYSIFLVDSQGGHETLGENPLKVNF